MVHSLYILNNLKKKKANISNFITYIIKKIYKTLIRYEKCNFIKSLPTLSQECDITVNEVAHFSTQTPFPKHHRSGPNEPKCYANVTQQKHTNNKYYDSTLDII